MAGFLGGLVSPVFTGVEAVGGLLGGPRPGCTRPMIFGRGDNMSWLHEQLEQSRRQHAELLQRFNQLMEDLKKKKIDSFSALMESDKERAEALIRLARDAAPVAMTGNNIGLFGVTSTGKSTMLNSLLGKKVAETGPGETTTEIKPYSGLQYTLWDIPGRNDEISYLTLEYISLLKGLSKRLVLCNATIKENVSLLKLLDQLGLTYVIVINKFDHYDEDEQVELKNKIHSETKTLGLKGVKAVFFISAKKPTMFPDWLKVVQLLTEP